MDQQPNTWTAEGGIKGVPEELRWKNMPDRIQHMHERLQEIVALQSAK
jgi:hypothetical protein